MLRVILPSRERSMFDNVRRFSPSPRAVRPAPDPLGLYLRAGRNDHRDLSDLLAGGHAACHGVVFDPTLMKRHAELREQVLNRKLDAILDPKTQQSALPGSYTDDLGGVPWGAGRAHLHSDFEGMAGRRRVAALGSFVLDHGFTQVLAPTHVLRSAADPWLAADAEATRQLRNHLDRRSRVDVPIIYSLASPYAVLRNREQRRRLIRSLREIPASAFWLKIEGFGSSSSATAARSYIEAAVEFHDLAVPLVADHVGGLAGLALLAFGAVGGIAHGITLGERFDANAWRKPRSGGGFGAHRRVYFPSLDLMLKPAQAKALLGVSPRARSLFGCKDTDCCPRNVTDQIENPGRHFLRQRMEQVSWLQGIPEELRPQRFLDRHVRPATDLALAAATINWEDDAMAKKTREHRKRLDSLRVVLGHQAANNPPRSFALLPETRAARETRP
jgi:hypothetical protein